MVLSAVWPCLFFVNGADADSDLRDYCKRPCPLDIWELHRSHRITGNNFYASSGEAQIVSTDSLIEKSPWIGANTALPAAGKLVAVKGFDTQGEWVITGGVWWQPYKGQSHQKGRWMQKNGVGIANRLPESDDVEFWRFI